MPQMKSEVMSPSHLEVENQTCLPVILFVSFLDFIFPGKVFTMETSGFIMLTWEQNYY